MNSHNRNRLIELIEQGAVPAEKIGDALDVARVKPDVKAWRRFIDRFLLWLGGLALTFALMFFVAYNWNAIGRFAKFGLVEAVIALAIFTYCRCAERAVAGKAALLVASICLGVLLALYGQTYQTGADPWQLFVIWALLMLPWAVIGRFPALWIVWASLMNLSLCLYFQTFRGMFWFVFGPVTASLWGVFLFNSLLLAIWEFLAVSRKWLSERWAFRLLAIGGGVPLTWLVLLAIFDDRTGGFWTVLIWAAWLATMYLTYRRKIPDLFMLAGRCLSAITVTISFLGRHLLDDSSGGGFLVLSLLVIGMGAGAAFWLKNIHRENRS